MNVWWVRGLVVAMLIGAVVWARALPQATIATVYFTDGRFLVPVSRQLPPSDDLLYATLEALLEGPTGATVSSV